MTWNTVESKQFNNISATPAQFTLRGGQYALTVNASVFGTITLQRLSPDATTWVTCLTAFSANGYATVNLPGGNYRILVAGITAGFVDITSVVTTM